MQFQRSIFAAATLVLAGVHAPLGAQPTAPGTTITAGLKVEDAQGGEVGTVVAVNGDIITIKTDRIEAQLPRNAFTVAPDKLLIGMTRAELNAEVERAQAEAQAKLVPGATVTGSKGTPVGTIETIDDQYVMLKLLSGKMIRMPRNSLGAGPQGGIIGLTAEELEAKIAPSR